MNGTDKRVSTHADFTIQSRSEYFRSLAKDIQSTKKGERVIVATASFDPQQELVEDIFASLNAAASRGVEVNILVDSYTFLINEVTKMPGPLWFSTNLDRRLRQPFGDKLTALRLLAANGGHYTVLNQPGKIFTIPVASRSHIKAVVINDIVYTGGCNLNNPDEIDVMLRWQDRSIADYLYELLRKASHNGNMREALQNKDRVQTIDAKARLLLDAGVKHQSIIFDEALAMIDEAREWVVLTSQYFAPGRGTKALARAVKRGVDVRFIFSHPSMHGPLEGTAHRIGQWRERQRLPIELFMHRLPKGTHLHAKLLATEQGAMIGSHNYAELGVQLATAEIAVHRIDPNFAKEAVEFIDQQLA